MRHGEGFIFLCTAPVEFRFNFESSSGTILMQLQAAADQTPAYHLDFLRVIVVVVVRHPPIGDARTHASDAHQH